MLSNSDVLISGKCEKKEECGLKKAGKWLGIVFGSLALLVVLVLVTYIPIVSLFLPNLLG